LTKIDICDIIFTNGGFYYAHYFERWHLVGKTTIQYQMIDALLKKGVPPHKLIEWSKKTYPGLGLKGIRNV
jgi:hypothetical protein